MGGTYKAPDYGAANREAAFAQAEVFPLMRQIESASRIGGKYTYPVFDKTGQPTGEYRTADFTGAGDVDVTKAVTQALNELAPGQAAQQLAIAQQFGTAFAEQRRKELEAVDPTRYGLYESFLKGLGKQAQAPGQVVPEAPTYERVGLPVSPQDTGAAAQMRSDLERQVAAGLAQAGTLDPSLMRAAQQAVRARGTATGNVLGNLQAFREANAVAQAIANADVQRRSQALGLLHSGQTTSDVANRQAQESFQNILAATGQRNTALQQSFAGQMAAQQQRQNVGQQNIANIQSALGLQPIVSQAAQLGALQQGASPFATPQLIQGMQQAGPGQIAQLGTSFALQNAQNQFQASQANSPLAVFKGITEGIGNLGSSFSGLVGCYVARECIPDQWEAFFFWKELVGPKWFKSLYDANAKWVANWIKDKPRLKKIVANWMLSKIKQLTHG